MQSKAWETHLVKCACRVLRRAPQGAEQALSQGSASPGRRRAGPLRVPGELVLLCVHAKAAQGVELHPGHLVRMHAPWHEIALGPGEPPALLAHLLS